MWQPSFWRKKQSPDKFNELPKVTKSFGAEMGWKIPFQTPSPVIFTLYYAGFHCNILRLQGRNKDSVNGCNPRWGGGRSERRKNIKNKWKLHKITYSTSNKVPVNAESFQSPALATGAVLRDLSQFIMWNGILPAFECLRTCTQLCSRT